MKIWRVKTYFLKELMYSSSTLKLRRRQVVLLRYSTWWVGCFQQRHHTPCNPDPFTTFYYINLFLKFPSNFLWNFSDLLQYAFKFICAIDFHFVYQQLEKVAGVCKNPNNTVIYDDLLASQGLLGNKVLHEYLGNCNWSMCNFFKRIQS